MKFDRKTMELLLGDGTIRVISALLVHHSSTVLKEWDSATLNVQLGCGNNLSIYALKLLQVSKTCIPAKCRLVSFGSSHLFEHLQMEEEYSQNNMEASLKNEFTSRVQHYWVWFWSFLPGSFGACAMSVFFKTFKHLEKNSRFVSVKAEKIGQNNYSNIVTFGGKKVNPIS